MIPSDLHRHWLLHDVCLCMVTDQCITCYDEEKDLCLQTKIQQNYSILSYMDETFYKSQHAEGLLSVL